MGTIVAAARGVPTTVPRERMQAVYEELKTPYKWGPVLNGPNGTRVDNPRVFRAKDTWYMTYNHVEGSGGYEGWLATSDDLVRWTLRGRILAKGSGGWDTGSVGVYLGLQSLDVDRAYLPETFEGRYWLSYIGGRKDGFEAYPLNIGLASTDDPARVDGWRRLPENPILAVDNPDVGWWENRVQFASQLVRDPARKLGYEFLLFYNAKGRRDNVERIGVAGSHDLRHWQRPLRDPIVAGDPDFRISGDPQLLQMGDLYVLLYFRGVPAQEEVGDHETFACSYDLVHWTPWTGTGLTRVREPWEGRSAAHKPWVFRWQGVVYHFFNYTHVIDKKPYGGIGLATSRFIGKSYQCEELEIDRADGGYVVVPGMKLAGYRGVEFRGRQAGDAIRFVVEVPEAGEYDLRLGLLAEGNGPRFRALLDDAPLGGVLQPASEPTMRTECGLGVAKLDRAGAHRLTLVLEDDALRSGGGYLVLDSIECRKR
ncbi:hypothetical protein DB354_06250 [Opitutus sp. ER46]|nr:hypothetical protein DB354_06250 [Opitutus sp. ER46]